MPYIVTSTFNLFLLPFTDKMASKFPPYAAGEDAVSALRKKRGQNTQHLSKAKQQSYILQLYSRERFNSTLVQALESRQFNDDHSYDDLFGDKRPRRHLHSVNQLQRSALSKYSSSCYSGYRDLQIYNHQYQLVSSADKGTQYQFVQREECIIDDDAETVIDDER